MFRPYWHLVRLANGAVFFALNRFHQHFVAQNLITDLAQRSAAESSTAAHSRLFTIIPKSFFTLFVSAKIHFSVFFFSLQISLKFLSHFSQTFTAYCGRASGASIKLKSFLSHNNCFVFLLSFLPRFFSRIAKGRHNKSLWCEEKS